MKFYPSQKCITLISYTIVLRTTETYTNNNYILFYRIIYNNTEIQICSLISVVLSFQVTAFKVILCSTSIYGFSKHKSAHTA